MTTNLSERVIEKITYKMSSQSIGYREIYKFKGYRLKIEICSDSFREQCYARISVLKDLEWSTLYTIPYEEMKTPNELIYGVKYRNNASLAESEFKQDILRLKDIVNELL